MPTRFCGETNRFHTVCFRNHCRKTVSSVTSGKRRRMKRRIRMMLRRIRMMMYTYM